MPTGKTICSTAIPFWSIYPVRALLFTSQFEDHVLLSGQTLVSGL